jgi:phage terminase small subunit
MKNNIAPSLPDQAPLTNPRHEAFALALAAGASADAAYVAAGYRRNRGNAARLKANESIQRRVAEISGTAAALAEVDLAAVLRAYARIAFGGLSPFLRVDPDGRVMIDRKRDAAPLLPLVI